jgi:hypothetical protein
MNRNLIILFACLLIIILVVAANQTPAPASAPLIPTGESDHASTATPRGTAPPDEPVAPTAPGDVSTPSASPASGTATPLAIPTLPPRDASAPSPTPLPPLTAEQWREWPVIPVLPASIRALYQRGLEMGNDPTNFSIIGDCQSVPLVFMGSFDERPEFWPSYDYTNLLPTLTHFQGSFGRRSGAVANGMSAASVFSPLWADQNTCQGGETPLECEFRLQQPSIVFVNLGTNYGEPKKHADYLRDILDFVLERGAIPILSTKGDNAEGDWRINEVHAEIALEYDVPLWNYWAAIQDLPNHGIDDARPEGNYLARAAWEVRSITGLQVLDVLLHDLQTFQEGNAPQQ